MKKFGLQLYPTTPIVITYRLAGEESAMLAPSAGSTIVFRLVRRRKTIFEDWIHPGINVAFLDFDKEQAIELGIGFGLTIYTRIFLNWDMDTI